MNIFKKNSQRGQVAIFIALIFQILFVFFAMMINVGLLVHHKINLQNSVDLAAYYGAMKQAEVMNVVAHINYQIRQSYKLMTWRYRHLGSYGSERYPGNIASGGSPSEDNLPTDLIPSFCITYPPFEHMNPNGTENYCTKSADNKIFVVNLPPTPASGGHFLFGFNTGYVAAVQAIQAGIVQECEKKNALSIFTLAMMLRGYKVDVGTRKQLAFKIANRLSLAKDDVLDLDGKKIKDGVGQTLRKNLTYQNADSIQFDVMNSLSEGECGLAGDPAAPPNWLKEVYFEPIYQAFYGDCSLANLSLAYQGTILSDYDNLPPAVKNHATYGQIIKDLIEGQPGLLETDGTVPSTAIWKSTLGFEKNPWCMAYYGVKAKAKPKIPFAPFGVVELEAKAIAKPFGGSIGPWFKKGWPRSSNVSSGDELNEVLPIRVLPGEQVGNPQDKRLLIDSPRYVGDKVGTNSFLTMSNYWRAFRLIPVNSHSIRLAWWFHLYDPNDDLMKPGTNGDFLAWDAVDPTNQYAEIMRNTEVSVISPDQYDSTHYTIEPDYYRNYYQRLKQQESDFGVPVRMDLGARHNDAVGTRWNPVSIKEQIKYTYEKSYFDVNNKMTYMISNFAELLTSYKGLAPDMPILDEANNFGKCVNPVPEGDLAEKATAGNCIRGGRSGYSVKLVHGDFLHDEMPNGGGPSITGIIRNPPPDNF